MTQAELRAKIRHLMTSGALPRVLRAAEWIAPGYVAQLEMGVRKNPSLEVLQRIAKALGVTVAELLK
ncbi:MAG: helix-turn-helix transcriptional regulator [Candidatus Rokubacteria bacterium]|nr:helix-turn-helix transcriptional regulator [Candidatus Rokubacteria bacterium]